MKQFNLLSIMYHYVRDTEKTEFPKIHACSVELFERQVDYLQKHHTLISWPEIRDFIGAGKPLPPNLAVLTFDDGVKDCYTHVFPILKKRNLSAIIFPIALDMTKGPALVQLVQFLLAKFGGEALKDLFLSELDEKQTKQYDAMCERAEKEFPPDRFGQQDIRNMKRVINVYMPEVARPIVIKLFEKHIGSPEDFARDLYLNEEEIEEMMAGGIYFGGHGTNHYHLGRITPEAQQAEIEGSRAMLERLGVEGPYPFSYPYGDYSESLFPLLKENNFLAAWTIKDHLEQVDPFTLGRKDTAFLKV